MQRKSKMLLVIILIVALMGCAKEETTMTSRETANSLSVENDVFTLDELVSQRGKTAEALAEFLKVESVAESYEAVLFGENMTIQIIEEEELITSLKLTFVGTDVDSLFIGISEQLGQDGVDEENTSIWEYGETTIVLSQEEDNCIVEIK